MRTINEIIIHCSATKEGVNFKAEDIDKWHKDKGWKGIGYHFVIDIDGTLEMGRPIEDIGAHCLWHNKHTIGICYVGGLDKDGKPKDTRTPKQKLTLLAVLQMLLIFHPTIVSIVGHNYYAARACPCFDAKKEYQWLLK